jgi:YD repeat-containing protein
MSASYDAVTGRLSDLAHTLGAADLARFAYTHNAQDQLISIDFPDATYAYDALGRRTSSRSLSRT